MKIKKSNLVSIYEELYEVNGFLVNSLDFLDEDQFVYVIELSSRIEKSLKYLDSINNKGGIEYVK